MKQVLFSAVFMCVLFFNAKTFGQQLKIEMLTPVPEKDPPIQFVTSDNNDTIVIKQQALSILLRLKILNANRNVSVDAIDRQQNIARVGSEYSYSSPAIPAATTHTFTFTAAQNMVNNLTININAAPVVADVTYAELDFSWSSLTENKVFQKTLVLKILKAAAKENIGDKWGWIRDKENYLKTEIVQYSDIAGLKNDRPNGLLQFQGIIKIPIYKQRWAFKNGWFVQPFRAVLIDAVLNRIDKSKEEVDYNYTNFLLNNTNDTAKIKSPNPWLATTDIWRYSNLQVGLRLVPLAIEKGNFRVQLQGGIKLLKNLPFTADTIRTPGPDSGKVKSDFRSVYSCVKYLELYIKSIETQNKINVSLNAGAMWLKLLDSYYQQIDIYQQDPFQKAVALSPVTKSRKSPPMWFASLRVGVALGEEKVVTTFLRVNYTLQTGNYLKPLTTNVVEGKPVVFEEKKFYNNFFQVHMGTTFDLDKIFTKKEDKAKKNDGPISNSVQ